MAASRGALARAGLKRSSTTDWEFPTDPTAIDPRRKRIGRDHAMKALVSADRPVVRIWHPDDPKQYVELQFENQQAADNAVEHLNRALKQASGMEFGEDE